MVPASHRPAHRPGYGTGKTSERRPSLPLGVASLETGAPPTSATAGVRPQWHLWAALAFLLALMLPACGGDSPTSPSSQFPNVAGTYRGPLILTIDGVLIGTIAATMTVVQSGSQLTIATSILTGGETTLLPAVTGTVNATGFLTLVTGGATTVTDPTCGLITATSASLTFSGNTARFVSNVSTAFCGDWSFSGTPTR